MNRVSHWTRRFAACSAAALGFAAAQAHAQADAPWVARANMNTERSGHASVALDGKLVVIGGVGRDGHILRSVEMYDPAQDRWSALPPLPEPRVNHGAAVCSTGQIIVAGGFADAGSTRLADQAFAFDPKGMLWRPITPPPVRRGSPGMAPSDDGRVFLVGGAPALRTVDAYECAEDRWVTMPSMITGRQKPGVAFIEAELYVIGGRTTDDPDVPNATLDVLEVLNFRGQWETRAPMPTPRSDFAFVNLADEFGLAVGGTDGRSALAGVDIYIADDDVWRSAAPLPIPVRGGAGASFPFDTMVFFTGGASSEPALPAARLLNFRALLDPRLAGPAFAALRGPDDPDDD